ncbi:tRNA pseudouridine(55) synthase TruB [Dyella sp. 2HG41-7]|uniref:tRNA pseudouridine(55) synthase TruB n=1 Tax=Dyella sp. 2HG41-7 TaxID=2883239 RepID=UPI001F291AEE|nr:tRNA pseudouridine(55) synthase TruB [Dyella sp. 2HG41-7]
MSRRRHRPHARDLHGILLLDKPLHMSSNKALQVALAILRAAKGGHTGALDPLATGLLPLCFGEATKIAGNLLGSRKAYVAECRLGVTTTTADLEGEEVNRRPVPVLDDAAIEAALASFRGRIVQVPPVYSALKQGGEPLYLKARRGEDVMAPPRQVDIYALDLLARTDDTLTLHVECGSGTYIRSLAVDLGEKLGCGAHLSGLRRLWVDPFRAPVMITMDALREAAEQGDHALDQVMLPLSAGVADWPAMHLDEAMSLAVSRGRQIEWPAGHPDERSAVFAADGRLLALVDRDEQNRIRILRGFNLPVPA